MQLFSRQSRYANATKEKSINLRIDHLEDRLTPSAFGPADGAYFAEAWNGRYEQVKVQPGDQKLVTAGTMIVPINSSSQYQMAASRYDSLGNIDIAYGTNGVFNSLLGSGLAYGEGLALQADGKAIISGHLAGTPNGNSHFVARLKTNGTLDNSYAGGGVALADFAPTVFASSSVLRNPVALQSTGKAVLATDEDTNSSIHPAVVARFTTNGVLDAGKAAFGTVVQGKAIGYTLSSFGENSNVFEDLVIQPDDKIVTVGTSTNDGMDGFVVVRYTANGALDTTFNGSGFASFLIPGSVSARPKGIARQADGKFVVVGSCTEVGAISTTDAPWDIFVARFNTNGTLDTSFGAGMGYYRLDVDGDLASTSEVGSDIQVQPDGKIVIAGMKRDWAQSVSSPFSVLVARFNSNGTLDTTFSSIGMKIIAPPVDHGFSVYSLAQLANGNIIVAGSEFDGTDGHPMLMRFYGTASPLQAASNPSTTNTHTITLTQVQPLLTEAITRWRTAGFNVSSLSNINLRIVDLPGNTLGQVKGNTITLDSNAAGWGWFVDKSPRNDSEFRTRGNQGEQGRMDLLTVLQHEVGHLLGVDHQDAGVMADTLFAGVRRSPASLLNPSVPSRVDLQAIFSKLRSMHLRKQ